MSLRAQKIVTVIQARMSSTRLPGKVMFRVFGRELLSLMVERVRNSKLAGTIVVATTVNREDNVIVELCRKENIQVFRGDEKDVLDRHYKTAIKYDADIIVKIPSDCPLIDPAIVDKALDFYIANQDRYDYVSNLHPASYPDGNDVEAFSFSALHIAWKEAKRSFEREHTTPYMWDNSNMFGIGNVRWETGLDYSMTHRWTIDYEEDFDFIRAVFEELYPRNPGFGLSDIIDLTSKRSDIRALNSKYAGVNWYRNHLSELKTIKPQQTKSLTIL